MEGEKISITGIIKDWADDYNQNKEQGMQKFLASKLEDALGEEKKGESTQIVELISSEVDAYEKNKQELQNAIDDGMSKEEWMSNLLLEETEQLAKEEQVKVLGELHNGLMDSMGITVEENQEQQKEAPLQNNLIAKSVGNLVTGKVMQALSEDSEQEEKEEIVSSEFVEKALEDNSDTELKSLVSGVMVALHQVGKLPVIPQTVPIQAVVHIACFAVDHARTVVQIARKEISLTEGLSRMTRDSFAAICGIFRGKHGKFTPDSLIEAIPILEKPLALVNKISQGITNLIGEEVIREKIKTVRERIIPVAQNFVQEFVHTTVSVVTNVASKIKNFLFG